MFLCIVRAEDDQRCTVLGERSDTPCPHMGPRQQNLPCRITSFAFKNPRRNIKLLHLSVNVLMSDLSDDVITDRNDRHAINNSDCSEDHPETSKSLFLISSLQSSQSQAYRFLCCLELQLIMGNELLVRQHTSEDYQVDPTDTENFSLYDDDEKQLVCSPLHERQRHNPPNTQKFMYNQILR